MWQKYGKWLSVAYDKQPKNLLNPNGLIAQLTRGGKLLVFEENYKVLQNIPNKAADNQ